MNLNNIKVNNTTYQLADPHKKCACSTPNDNPNKTINIPNFLDVHFAFRYSTHLNRRLPPAFEGGRRQAVGVLDVEGEGVSNKGYRRDV